MILHLAVSLLTAGVTVEVNNASAREVSIQALVQLPTLGAKDRAKLEIIARAIPKQTQDYPRRDILIVTGGQPVRCELTQDVLRICVRVQPDNVKAGLSLLESLAHKATLTQENLDAAILEEDKPNYWKSGLITELLPPVKLRQEEALSLYHRVVRPERLLLAVGGKIVPGQAQDLWEKRLESWNPGREPKGYFDESVAQERNTNATGITTVDFVGSKVLSTDAALSTEILAMFALGSGKGASLFRVVRERHGWSYRQEAILFPTKDGWTPHLLFATLPSDDLTQRTTKIREELIDDVKNMKQSDLARAMGMASAVLMRNVEFSPLYVFGSRPAGNSLEDQTFLSGYWMLKTGKAWNPSELLDSMKHVSLDDLKEKATSILESTSVHILPGS